jgi:uncharacterized protein YukE
VGVLDGFMVVWSNARATFGEGTPEGGAQFDASAQLHELQSKVNSAAPGARWSGSGADAYADTNDRQARTLGKLAELDQRLGSEVDRSAWVVAAGRRDLDAVRQWVTDAAATVPNSAAGERMLIPVVSRGAGEIVGIVERSHTDLGAIARRIEALGGEYRALAGPFPRAPIDDTQSPDPQDVAQWYMDWEDLNSRIAKHNAVVPRPPWNTPAGVAYQAEKEELDVEQSKLILEAASLGIDATVGPTIG